MHAETICVVRTRSQGLLDAAKMIPTPTKRVMIVVGTRHPFAPGSSDWAVWPMPCCIPRRSRLRPHRNSDTILASLTHLCDGDAAGREDLVDNAIRLATDWKVPLRLMSLVAVGEEGPEDQRGNGPRWPKACRHAGGPGGRRSRLTAGDQRRRSRKIRWKAVRGLNFADSGSLIQVQPAAIEASFLGNSASKIMRALPVPMIVAQGQVSSAPLLLWRSVG